MNTIQDIATQAGYSLEYSGAEFALINKAIESGLDIRIVEIGKVVAESDGYKWNVRFRMNGKGMKFNLKKMDIDTLVTAYCKFAKIARPVDAHKCQKCNGTGLIEAFRHIANGVCFDCLGVGFTH